MKEMSKSLDLKQLSPENGFVIGETACGHEGDINKLFQLIDCVAEAGAQAIKFQIFVPLERATEDHPEWDIFNQLTLSSEDWRKAADYARKKSLLIFADIFGNEGFSIAKELNMTEHGAKNLMQRANKKLRECAESKT